MVTVTRLLLGTADGDSNDATFRDSRGYDGTVEMLLMVVVR